MTPNSILGILDSIFPWMIADKIYWFLIEHYKYTLLCEFKLLHHRKGIIGILDIKKQKLAEWPVIYELIWQEKYKYIWNNPIEYRKSLNSVLLNNHLCLNSWKKRQRKRTKILQKEINK